MNLNKNIVLSAIAALGLGSASASVTYVDGSTAFQKVADLELGAFVTNNHGSLQASDNSSLGKETNIIWVYNTNTTPSYIVAHWTGSEGGVQTVDSPASNPVQISFYATNITGGIGGGGTNATVTTNAQIAFCDTYYTASLFRPGAHAGDGRTYATPASNVAVAAQAFVWAASANMSNTGVTGITSQEVRAGYANGYLSFAFFTGNASDTTNSVFFVGRNFDSGSRLTAMAESGVGAISSVQQCQITNNTAVLYPAGTVNGITAALGNNGYTSTGGVEGAITNAIPAFGSAFDPSSIASGNATGTNYVVGYFGASHGTDAGVYALNWNGVPYSLAAMENGQYTFWGYEQVLLSPNFADSAATNVYTNLVSLIKGLSTSALGAGNASLSDMNNVTRTQDGGVVTQNY